MKRHKKKVSSKEISKDFKKREANKFNKTHSGKLTQSKIEEHIKLLEKVKEERKQELEILNVQLKIPIRW